MLPVSPCFPSRHASYLTMIPILPCVTSDHVSHLAMPNCSHLTKNYCARLPWYHHGRVDGLAFYQSGLFWGEPHFWQEWPDLKGIFGMKAFCQETRQDSGHSQAARRARQGSSWTATKQKLTNQCYFCCCYFATLLLSSTQAHAQQTPVLEKMRIRDKRTSRDVGTLRHVVELCSVDWFELGCVELCELLLVLVLL